jgi:hypothetical protein
VFIYICVLYKISDGNIGKYLEERTNNKGGGDVKGEERRGVCERTDEGE